MKKLLFVWVTCKDSSYPAIAVNKIRPDEMEVTRIPLKDYGSFDDSGYDFLIYNTFAVEDHIKFDKEATARGDEKYLKFKGKKILLDSHDDGTIDGFARFNDRKNPRIKYTPGYDFMKEFNVIISIPIKVWWVHVYNGDLKTNLIAYTGRKKYFPHTIREEVERRLIPFKPFCKWQRSMNASGRILRESKIGIGVPGWGPIGSAHNETLAAKALLFSYETINLVKLLPFDEMIEGVNFISFNLNNLEEKLNFLLEHEAMIREIAEDGHKTFKTGYNPRRTAEQILEFFK